MIHDLRFVYMLAAAAVLSAHDIPTDVVARVLVKPAGSKLQVWVRVPLKAMRDVEFPEQGNSGYLDLDKLRPRLGDAATQWIAQYMALYEDGVKLPKPRLVATRISLPSEREFDFNAPPLENSANVVWNQVNFDVGLEFPIKSARARFSVRPNLEHLGERVVTALIFEPPGGAARVFEFREDPGVVELDPSWYQAARRFVRLGFEHILDGIDHLLFLLCLVIPFRQLRPLVIIVTAFTVAHSITLIASAYDLTPGHLWFPPLIETLIAASIVFMALENIVGASSAQRRWLMAFGFGLIHGFGFSFALQETLQFAGSHRLNALLAFNVGVELGQLLVLMLLIPILEGLFKFVVNERMGTIILSALVAHTAWHWMTERWDRLAQYSSGTKALMYAAGATALLFLVWQWRLKRSVR